MRRVIKTEEVCEIYVSMTNILKRIESERDNLSDNITRLELLGTSPNFKKIVSIITRRRNELNIIINNIEYYLTYIDKTMNIYDSKFNYYKEKINESLKENVVNAYEQNRV